LVKGKTQLSFLGSGLKIGILKSGTIKICKNYKILFLIKHI